MLTKTQIYFCVTENKQYVKIGSSKNPLGRINELQTGCPQKLVLLGSIPGSKQDEYFLHDLFRGHHINGEWFSLCQSLSEVIDTLLKCEFGIIWHKNKVTNSLFCYAAGYRSQSGRAYPEKSGPMEPWP